MDSDDSSCEALVSRNPHARVQLHRGSASIVVNARSVNGVAEFLLPADGPPIVAFRGAEKLPNNFASDLRIWGDSEFGAFEIHCPVCHTRSPMTDAAGGWSLVSPINQPVLIDYKQSTPATHVCVLLNNFDYGLGDPVVNEHGHTREGTPLAIQLKDRSAQFKRRSNHAEVFPLLRAGLLRSAVLAECVFELLSPNEDVMELALDIATLCTFAAGASVSVPMIEYRDADGRPARRIVTQPVRSRFQPEGIVADQNLPLLFEQSFPVVQEMRLSSLPWSKLASYCGSLEDAPFLEQKFAHLMIAVEFFFRTSLMEHGLEQKEVAKLNFQKLIGHARKNLGWEMPKHYEAGEATRVARNAVMHGMDLGLDDPADLRLQFNKWRLFLYRRVLIRLGYKGQVESVHKGWESSSSADDFSAEQNSFDTKDAAPDPWAKVVEHLRAAGVRCDERADGVTIHFGDQPVEKD